MIKENVLVVSRLGRRLNNVLGQLNNLLMDYQKADTFATLTPTQKADAIIKFNTANDAFETALTEFKTARDTTEPIEEV